tara:strand:+ start:2223 stop:2867 length:645 start_codon:yes stop_codon:yes gene_type:complete
MVEIRTYSEEDLESALALHQQVFADYTGEIWEKDYAARLRKQLSPDKAVVAKDGDKVVGLLAFNRFEDLSYPELIDVQHKLFYVFHNDLDCIPDLDVVIKNDLRNKQQELGQGEIVLEFFPTDRKNYPLAINGSSVLATDFAVHPDYQENGLGLAVAEYALDKIDDGGARRIYAQIVDDDPVKKVCVTLGFQPLIRLGPEYKNGSAATIWKKDL